MNREDQSVISHFIKYQAIYVFIAWAIASWTLFGTRIEALEVNDIKQDARIETNDLNSQEIRTRLSSIETSLEFIKLQLQ